MPIIAIVGRPNVGKSTLFNRLCRRRRSIVDDMPGVTRDRLYAPVDLDGRRAVLVDTGGLDPKAADPLAAGTHRQAEVALSEADLVLFVMDGRDGVTPIDDEVAALLRRRGDDVIAVVNKLDGPRQDDLTHEFHRLGFSPLVAVSAEHGRGIGALVDRVVERLGERLPAPAPAPAPEEGEATDGADAGDDPAAAVRIAVLGRPNAGKSTLVNRLVGTDRMLVSERPGTTRDAVDVELERDGRRYVLVDTAGIRRRPKIEHGAERFAVARAFDAVDRCDVAALLLDGARGVSDQDLRLAELALERGRSLLLLVNKWDLVEGRPAEHPAPADKVLADVKFRMNFADFAPIRTISAETGRGCSRILQEAAAMGDARRRRVPTAELNRRLAAWYQAHHPATFRGRHVRFYYGSQVDVAPPTFLFSVSIVAGVRPSYKRYIINKLRSEFGFEGAPLQLKFKTHRVEGDEAGGTGRRPSRRRTSRGSRR